MLYLITYYGCPCVAKFKTNIVVQKRVFFIQFSTSAELQFDFGAAKPNHVEIWHTCRLDEYLVVFFPFFENLAFWALGTRFSLKLQEAWKSQK